MTSQDGLTSPTQATGPTTAPKRPVTLTAAIWGGVLTSLLYVVGAVVMIVAGKASIQAYLTETVGPELSEAVQTASGAATDEAYQALVVKAGVAIGFALIVLLFTVLARGGATGARIGLAVALGFGMCAGTGLQLAESDVLPGISVVVAAVTPLIALVTVVVLFLPATNRYAAARRRSR